MEPEDFLCDFCHAPWAPERPFVEGHQGSCICGHCLHAALLALDAGARPQAAPETACVLCLEAGRGAAFAGAASPTAHACERCLRQAAGVLGRDRASGWRPPA